MYMPQQQGEQQPRKNPSQRNDSENAFLKLIYWVFQQAYDNRAALADLLYFLVTMYSLSMMMRPVSAAKTDKTNDDEHVIDEYKEPFCEKRNDGTEYCYERNARVIQRGNVQQIEYAYNERINNIGAPNFINHPRFQGRPAVYHENPNPHVDHGLQHGMQQGQFDPLNPHNFFAQGGGIPAIQHHQPGGQIDGERLRRLEDVNERLRNPRR